MAKDFRNSAQQLPRGLRNNNPFNLIKTSIPWKGKVTGSDPRFETFKNIYYGTRAGFLDIYNDYDEGKNTIRAILYEFAPPVENNTARYVKWVSDKIAVKPTATLNGPALVQAIKQIALYENGISYFEIVAKHVWPVINELASKKGLIQGKKKI